MPWNGSAPNKTFGRNNGFNTGSDVWAQDDAASVDIVTGRHDTHDQDLADGINTALCKDGGNAATANLQMGGFRLTNLGAGAARTESARIADVQDSKATYYPTVGGTADAITLSGAAAAITAYAAGQTFCFLATGTNTTAVTVNVDSVGVKNVKDRAGAALQAGAIASGSLITVRYDGTQFQADTGTAAVALTVGTVMGWPMTTVPTGWLECDGSAISRTTYAALFAVLSTSYGVGDGSTTFNLPNYKDYFLRGFDASGTEASSRTDRGDGTTGASVGTKQTAAFLRHNHGVTDPTHLHAHGFQPVNDGGANQNFRVNDGAVVTARQMATTLASTNTNAASTGITINNTAANDSTSETRPKNITVKWIILALPSSTLPAYGGGVPAASGYTAAPRNIHTGAMAAQVSTDGTDTTPATTETYIAEVFIPCNMTITGIAIFNGSAVAGNIAVALANSAGVVVASSASTAASGTDAYQRVAFSSAYSALGPATYYVLLQCNNTSNRFNSHTIGNFGASKKTGETYGTFTTVTAPTTFTTALGPIASLY